MRLVRRTRTISHVDRLCLLVAIVAAGGALLTGCGGSSSSSSSTPAAASTSGGSAATSTAGGGATSTGNSGGTSTSAGSSVANNPTVKAAVARCKQSIAAAPTLSADAKTKLEALCDKAAQGDPASLAKASAQVCQEIVKETVPSAGQQAALASCPKA